MEEFIQKLVDAEWEMFHSVNGDTCVSCQNDRKTFEIMRNAQYEIWPKEVLELYAADLEKAKAEGRNIVREKYIHMMRSTDPQDYEAFSGELPPVSEAKQQYVNEIWSHIAAQTEQMRGEYPILALGGRPLYAQEELGGWPSVETYQTSELLTYSEATLRALLLFIVEQEANGISYTYKVQENTVKLLGYPDMESAEKAMLRHQADIMTCESCG